jgi:hypothetical protein
LFHTLSFKFLGVTTYKPTPFLRIRYQSKIHAPLFLISLTNLVSHMALAANTAPAGTTGSLALFYIVDHANSSAYISVSTSAVTKCLSNTSSLLLPALPSRTSTANLIVSSAPPAVNGRVPVIFLQYSVLEEKTKPETQDAKDMPGGYPVLRAG